MLKNIWTLFMRDLKVNLRDFLGLYILLAPLLFGFAINALAPSVNDTTVNLAMLKSDDSAKIDYLEQFAKVELFEDTDAIKARLEKRDNIIAILPKDDHSSYILTQGNEPESVVEFASVLNAFHELGLDVNQTTAKFESFGRTEPPLKKMLVNIAIIFTSVLAGMIIAINIVEEKMDNTISAINVTPVSKTEFILGKSMMGLFLSIYGSIALVLITGYGNVNFGQMLAAVFSATLLTLLIGFIQGILNEDIMSAAAGIKILFLPVGAAVAAVELLSEKWQILFYWVPFYWSYKGNEAILSYTATWPQILGYAGIVLSLSAVVYVILKPKIQTGLSG